MNNRIYAAITNLLEEIKDEIPDHCTALEIFVSHDQTNYTVHVRSPESLRQEKISMKNIFGTWIK